MNRLNPFTSRGWTGAALSGLLLLFNACKTLHDTNNPNNNPLGSDVDKIDSNGVIIWRDPAATGSDFTNWLNSIKSKWPGTTVLDSCSNCDNQLMLLDIPNALNYLESSTAGSSGGSNNSSGVSGGNGGSFFGYACLNIAISLPTYDSAASPDVVDSIFPVGAMWPKNLKDTGLMVAVFDSGLEPAYGGNVATVRSNCLMTNPAGGASHGWNFITNSPITIDDHPGLHGTKVTGMILSQAAQYGASGLQILPVKVFDKTGRGDLFHILCGVAYATRAGAGAINASWGFYLHQDTVSGPRAASLMHHYLSYYLSKSNTLLIAAAGNDDTGEDRAFSGQGPENAALLRDIDSNQFYPAYFAHTDSNIIAVTTVSVPLNKTSPLQNYSNQTVDVGADCDGVQDGTFYFFDPLNKPTVQGAPFLLHTVTGSSFATPVVTGRIAALYWQVNPNTTKTAILPQLQLIPRAPHPALMLDNALNAFIKQGEVTIK